MRKIGNLTPFSLQSIQQDVISFNNNFAFYQQMEQINDATEGFGADNKMSESDEVGVNLGKQNATATEVGASEPHWPEDVNEMMDQRQESLSTLPSKTSNNRLVDGLSMAATEDPTSQNVKSKEELDQQGPASSALEIKKHDLTNVNKETEVAVIDKETCDFSTNLDHPAYGNIPDSPLSVSVAKESTSACSRGLINIGFEEDNATPNLEFERSKNSSKDPDVAIRTSIESQSHTDEDHVSMPVISPIPHSDALETVSTIGQTTQSSVVHDIPVISISQSINTNTEATCTPALDPTKCEDQNNSDNAPATSERSSAEEQVLYLRGLLLSVFSQLGVSEELLPTTLDPDSTYTIQNAIDDAFIELRNRQNQSSSGNMTDDKSRTLATSDSLVTASISAGANVATAPVPVWEEVTDSEEANKHKITYGLESPVITHLISNWTTDKAKGNFLKSWVRSLYLPEYSELNYPPGIQISNLSCVLRDGFMVLLVPLVKNLSKYPLIVHTRRHIRSRHKRAGVSVGGEESEGDPFASEEDALYDIRIKRTDVTLSPGGTPAIIGTTVGLSNETASVGMGGGMGGGDGVVVMSTGRSISGDSLSSEGASTGAGQRRYRVDSQEYYSPLSEINSFLPVIEAKTKRRIGEPYDATGANVMHSSAATGTGVLRRAISMPGNGNGNAVLLEKAGSAAVSAPSVSHSESTPAAAGSILQSLYSWWDPSSTATSTATTAAPLPPATSSTLDAVTMNTTGRDQVAVSSESNGRSQSFSEFGAKKNAERVTTSSYFFGFGTATAGGSGSARLPVVQEDNCDNDDDVIDSNAANSSNLNSDTHTFNNAPDASASASSSISSKSFTQSSSDTNTSAIGVSGAVGKGKSGASVNKITEKLQQIREQKLKYQQKNRERAASNELVLEPMSSNNNDSS